LTIDPISDDQLNKTNVIVTGTIDNADDTVTVNGVPAGWYDGEGNWEADNVPVSATGTAGLNAQVTDTNNNPVASENLYQPQPASMVIASYNKDYRSTDTYVGWCVGNGGGPSVFSDETEHWISGDGSDQRSLTTWCGECGYPVSPLNDGTDLSGYVNDLPVTWENASESEGDDSGTAMTSIKTTVKILPSGQQSIGQTALYLVQAQVMDEDSGLQLAASAVKFMNQLAGTATEDVTNSDSSVWTEAVVSGAAGAPLEATPIVAGNISYNGMQVSNVTLMVSASTNGVGTLLQSFTLPDGNPEFCVGQQITFTPFWLGAKPKYSHATADWTLPGTFVNEQSPTCDAYYDENGALLHQDSSANSALSTACWFVKDFKGGSVSLAMNLTLPDGKKITYNATGLFDMYRPSATFRPTYIGTPQVVANGSLTLYPPMNFAHDVRSDFPGVAGYTQLILVGSEYTDSSPLGQGHILDVGGVTPQTELDLGELYYGTQPITATSGSPAFTDAPLVGYAPTIYTTSMNINLQTYLLFKPNGSGSIFVPLQLVTWGLNDSAQYVGGAWQPSGSATGPNDTKTVAFPLWTNTFSAF
jgi:hypothetical protein